MQLFQWRILMRPKAWCREDCRTYWSALLFIGVGVNVTGALFEFQVASGNCGCAGEAETDGSDGPVSTSDGQEYETDDAEY
jgi:hypothetical protein